ncbi:glycosyltransferase [Paenibacillus vini]|uniref:Glycosyltransferase 2-like domain-containing protein n=1 Tax=Paenibacillus vini TaxID=1476024 RepID=A0ABQ4M6I5_9BACL|nr:glycosyltransferase [Paenibacillus vini]GIP51613.1 hypothetical protein J42TS3_06480 [Paenibacillus vini]
MEKASIIMACSSDYFEYTQDAVNSIRRSTDPGNYELIIVEHGNSPLRNWLKEQSDILTLFHEEQLTQGQAWNIGLQVATGESFLFLHSDTLVTEYWLEYLMQSLYQDESIAAVGPITNFAEGDQAVEVEYNSIEDMISYGHYCNRSFGQVEKLIISDFCLFIKKSIIQEIGPFDEKLDGNLMANDYCLRISEASYKLMICKHVFVHHYGEENTNSSEMERAFKTKWGFDSELTKTRMELYAQLTIDVAEPLRILEVGCGCGASLLTLKELYPEAEIYGIESNSNARLVQKRMQHQLMSSISDPRLHDESFDYIILNTTHNLQEMLDECYSLLKNDGMFIVDFPNIPNYSTVRDLVNGGGLGVRQLTCWSLEELKDMLIKSNFAVLSVEYVEIDLKQEEQLFVKGLKRLIQSELPRYFNVSSFFVKAQKELDPDKLHELFNQLFQNPSENIVNKILTSSPSKILSAIESYNGPIIPLLNYLAISSFEKKDMERVYPLLSKAHQLDPIDSTTLLNLGTVYYGIGDDDTALYWLKKIPEKSEQIEDWIARLLDIVRARGERKRKLKLNILRVEHNVQRKGAMGELVELLQKEPRLMGDLEDIIEEDIINKISSLKFMIEYSYDNEMWEFAIVIGNILLKYEKNDEILSFLGFLMVKAERFEDSLHYLKQIKSPNSQVQSLIDKIEVDLFS